MTEARDALAEALEKTKDGVYPFAFSHADAILSALPDGWVLARRREHRWQECTAGQDCPEPQCSPDDDGNCRACGNPFIVEDPLQWLRIVRDRRALFATAEEFDAAMLEAAHLALAAAARENTR